MSGVADAGYLQLLSRFAQVCDVLRQNTPTTKDRNGRTVEDFRVVSQSNSCFFQPGKTREMLLTTGDRVRSDGRLYLKGSISITEQDRVRIAGVEYQVIGIANPGALSHHIECDVLRVQAGRR